jgi:hypothetical protein
MAKKLIIVSESGDLFCVDTDEGTIDKLPSDASFVAAQEEKAGSNSIASVDATTASRVGCEGAVAAVIMVKL